MNNLNKFSFLITGGAGFIGSHIADELLRQGAGKVRVLDNFFNGSKQNIAHHEGSKAFEFMEGDIRDRDVCAEAMQGIDFVLHQAAVGSVPRSLKDPFTTTSVNLEGFINILMAAKEAGVKRLVYASSSSVYGDSPVLPKRETETGNPLSPYAASKRAGELYAKTFASCYGMEIVGLRYFNIFGPRQKVNDPYAAAIPLFIDAIKRGEAPVIYGNGEQSRDFTFVSNAVKANILALFAEKEKVSGKVFNIACGQRTSVNQLFSSIAALAGSKIQPQYASERKGDVKDSVADISLAAEALAYSPNTSFAEGLKATYNAF